MVLTPRLRNGHRGGYVRGDSLKDGKLSLGREKLETITQRLSRKFGVIIQLEDDILKDYEYTATFTDETLEDILDS